MRAKYRARTASRASFVSFPAARAFLLAYLGLIGVSSVLPAQARQNAASPSVKDAWRAAWQKKWIAELEAKQKATQKAGSNSSASTTAATTNTSARVKSYALPAQSLPAQALPAAPHALSIPSGAPGNPRSAVIKRPATKPVSVAAQPPDLLSQTKPDLFSSEPSTISKSGSAKSGDHTQDNAFAPVGDAWKLLAYLVPMLAVIMICLNLLKRFHTRTGRMPGLLQSTARYAGNDQHNFALPPSKVGILSALGGAFKKAVALNFNARAQQTSAIRLIESVPIGGANVHLLEVRGRVLLLGATAGSLNVLAEFDAQSGVGSDDFRDLLHTAAADMDALDYSQPDLPNTAVVTTLEGLLRETGQAVSQRSRRLRTVREVEGEDA